MTEITEHELSKLAGCGPAFCRSAVRLLLGKRDHYTGDDLRRLMAAHQARRAGISWKQIRRLYPRKSDSDLTPEKT